MIRIRVRRHDDGGELFAIGHAGYAAQGSDIVCAGVSALLFGFLAYLTDHASSAVAVGGGAGGFSMGKGDSGGHPCPVEAFPHGVVEYATEKGLLWVRTHGMQGADAAAWAVTFAGLSLLSKEYPTHVSLAEDA